MGRIKTPAEAAHVPMAQPARLLVCARRLYANRPVTAKWIVENLKCGIAAARRDMRSLRMYLPVDVVDHDENRGRGRNITILRARAP